MGACKILALKQICLESQSHARTSKTTNSTQKTLKSLWDKHEPNKTNGSQNGHQKV